MSFGKDRTVVHVLAFDPGLSARIRALWPGSASVVGFSNPLDALAVADCARPSLLIVELDAEHDTWISVLDYYAEMTDSPRRVMLASPDIIEEVLEDQFRPGLDIISLWPGSDEDLSQVLRNTMFVPTSDMTFEATHVVM